MGGAPIESRQMREAKWPQSIAVVREAFVIQVADAVNPKLSEHNATIVRESFVVCEPPTAYSAQTDTKIGLRSPQNALLCRKSQECVTTSSGPTQ